jgi:AraC family transcriptional regulator
MGRRQQARDESAPTVEQVSREIARFQESSNRFDEVAAAILGIERAGLPCMTLLLFQGPATARAMSAALGIPLAAVRDRVARLELSSFTRRGAGRNGPQLELTEHARDWIDRIWEPLQRRGHAVLAGLSPRDLSAVGRFLHDARALQEQHISALREWLREPAAARKPRQRGGLSPAALRRVQLFVEANLGRTIRIADLAVRAGLSPHHFGRAFRVSTGITPHAFIEQRRIARARSLIDKTTTSLARIAAETGFASQSHLTTAFRRATGLTPAVFRRGRRPV